MYQYIKRCEYIELKGYKYLVLSFYNSKFTQISLSSN